MSSSTIQSISKQVLVNSHSNSGSNSIMTTLTNPLNVLLKLFKSIDQTNPIILLSELFGISALTYLFYKKLTTKQQELNEENKLIIKQLFIYPIKSGKGISVNEWPISKYGFLYDRNWMIVKESTMKLISQREIPKMCFLNVDLKILDEKNVKLIVEFPNKGKKEVNLINNLQKDYKIVKVNIWNEFINGIDCGDELANWLTDCLQQKVRLVQTIPDDMNVTENVTKNEKLTSDNTEIITKAREIEQKYLFNDNITKFVTFPDGFPFLLILENSIFDFNLKILKELNNNLNYLFKKYILKTKLIEVDNFRPNILVSSNNELPYSEEKYKILNILNSNITLYGLKRCTRCTMPSVNFRTGTKNSYILDCLNKYRFDENVNGTIFGMNISHDKKDVGKVIKVGDVVEIVQRGDII
ncbi:hypothetical protein ABK040_016572 [Willaertia magna]